MHRMQIFHTLKLEMHIFHTLKSEMHIFHTFKLEMHIFHTLKLEMHIFCTLKLEKYLEHLRYICFVNNNLHLLYVYMYCVYNNLYCCMHRMPIFNTLKLEVVS